MLVHLNKERLDVHLSDVPDLVELQLKTLLGANCKE